MGNPNGLHQQLVRKDRVTRQLVYFRDLRRMCFGLSCSIATVVRIVGRRSDARILASRDAALAAVTNSVCSTPPAGRATSPRALTLGTMSGSRKRSTSGISNSVSHSTTHPARVSAVTSLSRTNAAARRPTRQQSSISWAAQPTVSRARANSSPWRGT